MHFLLDCVSVSWHMTVSVGPGIWLCPCVLAYDCVRLPWRMTVSVCPGICFIPTHFRCIHVSHSALSFVTPLMGSPVMCDAVYVTHPYNNRTLISAHVSLCSLHSFNSFSIGTHFLACHWGDITVCTHYPLCRDFTVCTHPLCRDLTMCTQYPLCRDVTVCTHYPLCRDVTVCTQYP